MKRVVLAIGVAAHLYLQLAPAWDKVSGAGGGRDFASYYYAVQAAAGGGDPYDTAALDRLARDDRTRRAVNPFFYPPPFLLAVAWALPLSLKTASLVMLALNEALLATGLWILRRSFGVPLWAIALVLATFTPIPDNAWMGQANLLALVPALAGLALATRRPLGGGVLVGIAAMMKMSPALFLLYWAIRREWRPIAAAVATAVGLSLLTLPLVGPDAQIRFYTEILPGFPSGDYHGLTVPISLPANHSIPDVFDRLWSAPSKFRLADAARHASLAATAGMLALWAWVFRRRGSEAAAIGALTVVMVITPVYTYEHHLVFLLPAVLVTAGLVSGGRSPAFFVAYFFLAWPLGWLRWTQRQVPFLDDVLRESKFLAEIAFFLLCLAAGRRRRATAVAPAAPGDAQRP